MLFSLVPVGKVDYLYPMTFGFEWDEVNTAKVLAHGVSLDEAELVLFADDAFSMPARQGRMKVYGTVNGKFLCVLVSQTAEDMIRVTTAYRVNPKRIKR